MVVEVADRATEQPVLRRLATALRGLDFAGGFKAMQLDPAQEEKFKQANIRVRIWVAASATEAAVLRVALSEETLSIHAQFPLTAPLPPDASRESLMGVLALGTFLPQSGFVLDPRSRVAWNAYSEHPRAEVDEAIAQLRALVAMRRQFGEAFFQELRRLGFSTDLSKEVDLLNAAGAPITLSPAEMQALSKGFLRSLVVNLALGTGSAIIAGATGGVGVVVGVVGEAAYGAALS